MISDFFRGDSKGIKITIESKLFEGGTAWLTLKTDKGLEDTAAVLQKTTEIIEDPDDGDKNIAIFDLATEDTDLEVREYYYDIQLVSSDESIVRTIISSSVKCLRDVTRETVGA